MSPGGAPTVREIADHLGAADQVESLAPDVAATLIEGPAPVDAAGPHKISFIDGTRGPVLEQLQATAATLVLLGELPAPTAGDLPPPAVLSFPNPRLAFIRVLRRFFAPPRPVGIHPTAVVDEGANIASSAYVGPMTTIGAGCSVGEGTVIRAGVHVYPGCSIGADCTIDCGAVIGADGFGYERDEDGVPVLFPHLGTVVIEDDVEIGANASINRGALGETRIASHARIDDMVYIAHNVQVGEGAMVVAMTSIAGGARVGERTYLAPSAAISNAVRVGAEATVGLGAVVLSDVAAGAVVAGNPARDIEEIRAANAALRELARKRG